MDARSPRHEAPAALVSDEVVNELVEERLDQPDAAEGFILDGYPRTAAQAEQMVKLLAGAEPSEVVIHSRLITI